MAPVRVLKGLHEAIKKTIPNVGPKPHQGSSLPKDNSRGQDVHAEKTFTNLGTKKFQSRRRRANRFGDHGSSSAFKKVVRRRQRVHAHALGLPSTAPITHDFQPRTPTQRQIPATDQPPVTSRTSGSRQATRESRFAEKHLSVPLTIYLACKTSNTPHRGPTKFVERHGSEWHRSRLVLLSRAKGSPFQGSKRRAIFVQSPEGLILEALFHRGNEDTECESPSSSPTSRTSYGVEEARFSSPPSKEIPEAPSQDPLDEMEDVIPAPLIYQHLTSQPVQTIPAVPTPPLRALRTPAPAQSSRVLPAVPPTEQLPLAQPIQPSQLLPTMSHFCRNLGRVSKEMVYVLRALSAVRARERCAHPPTTPVASKTQSSYLSATLARPPPAPTKARLPYARPGILYVQSDG